MKNKNMKKLIVLLLFVIILPACSFYGSKSRNQADNQNLVVGDQPLCLAPTTTPVVIATTTATTTATNDLLPPISLEEQKKTFTFEDDEMGVKLKYPGSCFFNKGIFECSNFTMSIWLLEGVQQTSKVPEIIFKNNETQVKYVFVKGDKAYSLMAWYEGQDRKDVELLIDKIAKTFTFTR